MLSRSFSFTATLAGTNIFTLPAPAVANSAIVSVEGIGQSSESTDFVLLGTILTVYGLTIGDNVYGNYKS